MNKTYELVVIFKPELKAEEKEKLLEAIKKIISQDGKISEAKDWGKKELAYPIKKERTGDFYWLNFDANSSVATDIEKRLKLEDKILRYLLIKA